MTMGMVAARFFAYLQGAGFYRDMHEKAVALLPNGTGRTWLDIGCGPGLVARLAAEHGYRTTGRDIDNDMVAMAQYLAQRNASSASFEVGELSMPPPDGQLVDVVSAASLLFVLDDRPLALRQLMAHLKDNGVLLIIETSPGLRFAAAWRWLWRNGYSRRAWMLLLWAWVRHGNAIDERDFCVEGWRIERVPLMDGLVDAWILRRSTSSFAARRDDPVTGLGIG